MIRRDKRSNKEIPISRAAEFAREIAKTVYAYLALGSLSELGLW